MHLNIECRMQRCIGNWQQIFFKEALHQTRPLGFDEEIVRVIDWGDVLEEMNWADFLRDYPKDHAGFIAVGRSGNLGFLETHEDHPKLSKHYYIYSI